MFSVGLLIGKCPFLGLGNAWIKLPFSGHIANKFRRPTILHPNIEGLIASKMNVLHHLALQSEALVILLHKITALMQRSWSSKLSTSWVFKQEVGPCHICPQLTKVHTFGPISTEIKNRVVVHGY